MLLWKGSASSVVDLNGSSESSDRLRRRSIASSRNQRIACRGVVGIGREHGRSQSRRLFSVGGTRDLGQCRKSATRNSALPATSQTHAVLWNSSAGSAVLLKDTGFVSSEATGISNGKIVGFGVGQCPDQGDVRTRYITRCCGQAPAPPRSISRSRFRRWPMASAARRPHRSMRMASSWAGQASRTRHDRGHHLDPNRRPAPQNQPHRRSPPPHRGNDAQHSQTEESVPLTRRDV